MHGERKLKSAPVGVVGKVLRILEVLDRAPQGLPLKDIADVTALNKSTAHRFVAHLEGAGYLFRDESKAYMIGPKLVRLGSGTTYQTTLCRLSRPVLSRLWKLTGETVNLAVLDGREVFYVDVLESLHTFRLVSQVGMRRPLHSTALGKAILSRMESAGMEEALHGIRFEPSTPKTITSVAHLKKDLSLCASRRFALDDEEVVSGARCIGAAILDSNGKVAAGISVSGPVVRLSREKVPHVARAVCLAADEISRKLGYDSDPLPELRRTLPSVRQHPRSTVLRSPAPLAAQRRSAGRMT
jgi:IclR family acetate operon transcriptional repressor